MHIVKDKSNFKYLECYCVTRVGHLEAILKIYIVFSSTTSTASNAIDTEIRNNEGIACLQFRKCEGIFYGVPIG